MQIECTLHESLETLVQTSRISKFRTQLSQNFALIFQKSHKWKKFDLKMVPNSHKFWDEFEIYQLILCYSIHKQIVPAWCWPVKISILTLLEILYSNVYLRVLFSFLSFELQHESHSLKVQYLRLKNWDSRSSRRILGVLRE